MPLPPLPLLLPLQPPSPPKHMEVKLVLASPPHHTATPLHRPAPSRHNPFSFSTNFLPTKHSISHLDVNTSATTSGKTTRSVRERRR
ncbi:hypothetical protein HanIR_Chr06g0277071 [Helianthus annuus]|nr:hypothetical protein HanIR_Chr06g0277071 [Helianthus annuus]